MQDQEKKRYKLSKKLRSEIFDVNKVEISDRHVRHGITALLLAVYILIMGFAMFYAFSRDDGAIIGVIIGSISTILAKLIYKFYRRREE